MSPTQPRRVASRRPRLLIAAAALLGVAGFAPVGLAQGLGTAVQPGPAAPAANDSTPQKLDDIRKLLDLSGTPAMAKTVFDQMMGQFRMSMPNVPQDVWNELATEITPQSFTDLIIPIYDRNLTHDDVKGLIAFYESPVGKKFVSVQPAIAQQSMAAGQQWGQQVAQKVLAKLRARGISPNGQPTGPSGPGAGPGR